MTKKNVYLWVDRFKRGRETLDDEEWSGRPSTSWKITTLLTWRHWLNNEYGD
jgi:hypothetical protein